MKILQIIPQLSSGGAERFTVDLCNELADKHEVYLLVLHHLDKSTNFYFHELSSKVKVLSLNKGKGMDLSLFFKVNKAIRQIQPDIVQTHLRAIIYVFAAIFTFRHIKFYHTVHNDAPKEAGDRISTFVRKYSFKNKKICPVTISVESTKSFVDFYGISPILINNGRNIPNQINPSEKVQREFEKYKPTGKTRVLINLARIDTVKRQTMLAKIVHRLNKEGYENYSVLMIGSTKYENLVAEIHSYDCPNLYVLGERTNPLEYLALADSYCLCSSYEGMPISLIEALGVGIVPVCTPVGGIVDVIHDGENGFLSEDLSEESYYNALVKFLNLTDDELQQMKEKSKQSYLPYSMTQCAANYIKLFNS